MEGFIDLKSLTLDELAGVVNLYPWFPNARKELCCRLFSAGDDELFSSALTDASLYVPAMKVLSGLGRNDRADCSDKDMETILKTYISGEKTDGAEADPAQRQVYVVGGDYFSQEQYDSVRTARDAAFSRLGRTEAESQPKGQPEAEDMPEFYTETLAGIYADQGYPEQARKIYSKLILAYPEKNAYFAALIRKLEQEN